MAEGEGPVPGLAPPAQRLLAERVMADPEGVAFMTVSELATVTGVNESTVVRFASGLGLDGYPGLTRLCRAMLRAEAAVPTAPWRLHLLVPAEAVVTAAEMDRRNAVLGLSLLGLALSYVLYVEVLEVDPGCRRTGQIGRAQPVDPPAVHPVPFDQRQPQPVPFRQPGAVDALGVEVEAGDRRPVDRAPERAQAGEFEAAEELRAGFGRQQDGGRALDDGFGLAPGLQRPVRLERFDRRTGLRVVAKGVDRVREPLRPRVHRAGRGVGRGPLADQRTERGRVDAGVGQPAGQRVTERVCDPTAAVDAEGGQCAGHRGEDDAGLRPAQREGRADLGRCLGAGGVLLRRQRTHEEIPRVRIGVDEVVDEDLLHVDLVQLAGDRPAVHAGRLHGGDGAADAAISTLADASFDVLTAPSARCEVWRDAENSVEAVTRIEPA